MLRYFFILLFILSISLLFLYNGNHFTNQEKPIFLQHDSISNNHKTKIDIKIKTAITPTPQQLAIFKKDYGNIWAHLNYLYTTNNVVAGKEYYTEDWFKQICLQYKKTNEAIIYRTDVSHQVRIENWATDGLVCTLTDSVKMAYTFPNKTTTASNLPIAMVLLYQGDHWRIDAIKVETP